MPKIQNKEIVLAKPTTGMNRSGLAVRQIVDKWNVELEDLFLMVDDVDLDLGTVTNSTKRRRWMSSRNGISHISIK